MEQAKLLALQVKEHSKRNLKLLEKLLKLEKERLLSEAAEAHDKATLAELETKHNETTSSSPKTSSKSKSLDRKTVDSFFLQRK